MARHRPVIAWDTCVLLDFLDRRNAERRVVDFLDELVAEAERSDVPIMIPAVVIAEIVKHKDEDGTRRELTDQQIDTIKGFMDRRSFDVRPTDRASAHRTQYIARSGLCLGDALIAGTAVRHGAKVLLTRDGIGRKSKKSKLLSHDRKFEGMRIRSPIDWQTDSSGGQANLFTP